MHTRVFILLVLILVCPLYAQYKSSLPTNTHPCIEYVPDEILVVYKSGVSTPEIKSFHASKGLSEKDSFYATHRKDKLIHKLKVKKDKSVVETIEELKKDPRVEYAQPNYIYKLYATPNDPSYGQLWGLKNTGQSVNGTSGSLDADIDADSAWDITTGDTLVKIAVIDSGYLLSHPDLILPYWINSAETINGIDDDGNGLIDDRYGWDFFDNDNDVTDYDTHGSHVAGTIAASGNNAAGITGVCWNGRIIPLKIGGISGYVDTQRAILATNYAVDKGARIINASWGGPGGVDGDLLYQAIKAAGEAGVLFVAAAGNGGADGVGDNNDFSPHYPSNYSLANIISVSATDQNDNLASFSNYGATSVDIAAPGVNIYSTIATYTEGSITQYSSGFDTTGERSGWWSVGIGNNWAFTNSKSVSPSYSFTDSPSGNYANNLVSTRTYVYYDVPIGYTKDNKYILQFKVNYALENGYDYLDIIASNDKTNWLALHTVLGDTYRITGDSSNNFLTKEFDITKLVEVSRSTTIYIGFGITSDSYVNYDGVYIDDVKIIRKPLSIGAYTYDYKDGTSMAAPHISGIAGLVLSKYPALSVTDLKESILSGVDKKYSLSNKVLTGGRANAYKALIAASCLPEPSNVTGIALSTYTINWQWQLANYNRSGLVVCASTWGAISPTLSKSTTFWTAGYTSGPNTPQQIYVVSFSSGVSDYSEVVFYATASVISSVIYTLSNPPSVPYFDYVSKYVIMVDWDANSNPYSTRWLVERSTDANNYQTLKSWGDVYTLSYYSDYDINFNTTYYYRIAAYNNNQVKSSYSAVISTIVISTLAPPPANPRASSSSKSYIYPYLYELKISWDANGNPSDRRWRVDRSTVSSEQSFNTLIGWYDVHTYTYYTDRDILPNVTYYYKIASLNDDHLENFCPVVVSTCIIENKIAPSNPYTEPTLSKGEVGVQFVGSGVNSGYITPGEKANIYFVPLTDGIVNIKVVTPDGGEVYSSSKYATAGRADYFEFYGNIVKTSGIYPVIVEGAGIKQIKKICVIK